MSEAISAEKNLFGIILKKLLTMQLHITQRMHTFPLKKLTKSLMK